MTTAIAHASKTISNSIRKHGYAVAVVNLRHREQLAWLRGYILDSDLVAPAQEDGLERDLDSDSEYAILISKTSEMTFTFVNPKDRGHLQHLVTAVLIRDCFKDEEFRRRTTAPIIEFSANGQLPINGPSDVERDHCAETPYFEQTLSRFKEDVEAGQSALLIVDMSKPYWRNALLPHLTLEPGQAPDPHRIGKGAHRYALVLASPHIDGTPTVFFGRKDQDTPSAALHHFGQRLKAVLGEDAPPITLKTHSTLGFVPFALDHTRTVSHRLTLAERLPRFRRPPRQINLFESEGTFNPETAYQQLSMALVAYKIHGHAFAVLDIGSQPAIDWLTDFVSFNDSGAEPMTPPDSAKDRYAIVALTPKVQFVSFVPHSKDFIALNAILSSVNDTLPSDLPLGTSYALNLSLPEHLQALWDELKTTSKRQENGISLH